LFGKNHASKARLDNAGVQITNPPAKKRILRDQGRFCDAIDRLISDRPPRFSEKRRKQRPIRLKFDVSALSRTNLSRNRRLSESSCRWS
jgi:hypothetical protein